MDYVDGDRHSKGIPFALTMAKTVCTWANILRVGFLISLIMEGMVARFIPEVQAEISCVLKFLIMEKLLLVNQFCGLF